jgi:hypothetical protein
MSIVSTRERVTASLISEIMAGTVKRDSALLIRVETEGSFLIIAPVSRTRVWASLVGSSMAAMVVGFGAFINSRGFVFLSSSLVLFGILFLSLVVQVVAAESHAPR